MDDTELVTQARTDAEAFAELYRRHVTRVYRYYLAHTGSVVDAEDLTSQTFVAVLESLRTYRGSGSFAAWVMGIAMRKRLMFFRRTRRAELSLDAALDVPDPGHLPEATAFQRMQLARVLEAIHSLAADRREAIALCFFAGLDYAEAARVLGKSEPAVRMLVSRALQDLRTRTAVALEVEYD